MFCVYLEGLSSNEDKKKVDKEPSALGLKNSEFAREQLAVHPWGPMFAG